MALQSINKKVIFRIYGRGRGWAFSSNDFVEDFSHSQIDYALSDAAFSNSERYTKAST